MILRRCAPRRQADEQESADRQKPELLHESCNFHMRVLLDIDKRDSNLSNPNIEVGCEKTTRPGDHACCGCGRSAISRGKYNGATPVERRALCRQQNVPSLNTLSSNYPRFR